LTNAHTALMLITADNLITKVLSDT